VRLRLPISCDARHAGEIRSIVVDDELVNTGRGFSSWPAVRPDIDPGVRQSSEPTLDA
jgi:hypothetical protein